MRPVDNGATPAAAQIHRRITVQPGPIINAFTDLERAQVPAITFLLSPLAGSITGSDHRVDGGAVKVA